MHTLLGVLGAVGALLVLRARRRCRLENDIVIVVSTSSSRLPAAVQAAHTRQVLHSIAACTPLSKARVVLVFDALPTQAETAELETKDSQKWRAAWKRRKDYQQYCDALRAEHSSRARCWHNVQLLQLRSFGHLVGTVRAALEMSKAQFALVLQHDLALDSEAVAQAWPTIREALCTERANCVTLNRDAHASVRSKAFWRFEPELNLKPLRDGPELTAVVGFSDQAHFCNVAWYRSAVLGCIPPEQRTCMEHRVHQHMKDRRLLGCPHAKTFLLGGMRDDPALVDLMHGQISSEDGWLAAPHPDSEWRAFYVDGAADGGDELRLLHMLARGRAKRDRADGRSTQPARAS